MSSHRELTSRPHSRLKAFIVKFFLGFYVLLLIAVGARLFLTDQLSFFLGFFQKPQLHSASSPLTIAYALPSTSFEPTLFDSVTRSRLVDVYEGLVRTDRNLKIRSGLAVSWGLLDPLTWEFKLRPEVYFHNGRLLSSEDVLASLKRAQTFPESQLKNLLNSITDIKAVDASTLRITTQNPDPLLLNKLAVTFIFPANLTDFTSPIGTGPYSFVSSNGEQTILKSFERYWGEKPFYSEVILKTISDKEAREQAFKSGDVQILGDVPPLVAKSLETDEFTLQSLPSLEVAFVMFNLHHSILKEKAVRKAFLQAFDRQMFVDISHGFARPIGQFVSSGVFGFNPNILLSSYDLEAAKKDMTVALASQFEKITIGFDYPQSAQNIAEYIQIQCADLGIDLQLHPLSDMELQNKILKGDSDFYYLGWKSELGDSDDFLVANLHSRDKNGLYGQFNGSHYVNEQVDDAIEASRHNLNPRERLKLLQQIMKTAVEDDIVGIPLFESEKIFASRKELHFEPRVDGFIYASEIDFTSSAS